MMKKIIFLFLAIIILGGAIYLGWFFFLKEDSDWQIFKNPKDGNLDLKLIYANGVDHTLLEIHALSFEGNDQKILEVPTRGGLRYPSDLKGVVSPDGKKMAFPVSFSDPKKGLLVMNTDGSNKETLIDLKESDLDPTKMSEIVSSLVWSSDSKSILYLFKKILYSLAETPAGMILRENPPEEFEIWKINLETKEKEKLNLNVKDKEEWQIRLAGWLVENNEIYLTLFDDSTYKFFILEAKNGDVKETIDSEIELGSHKVKTAISPDYSKIAILESLESDKESKFKILDLQNLEIEEMYILSDISETLYLGVAELTRQLNWSPNSKKIAVGSAKKQLWLMDIGRKTFKDILPDNNFGYDVLGFSPDNKYIFYLTVEGVHDPMEIIFGLSEFENDLRGWQMGAWKTTIHRVKINGWGDKVFNEGWGIRPLGWGY